MGGKPACKKLLATRVAALRASRLLLEVLCVYKPGGAPVADGAEERDASLDLTYISRYVKEMKTAKLELDKHAGEESAPLKDHIDLGESTCAVLADKVADKVAKTAESELAELTAMAKGAAVPEAVASWRDLCAAAEDWPAVKELLARHLLPVDEKKLSGLLTKLAGYHQQYTDVCSKHKVSKDWAACRDGLQAARVTIACRTMVQAYVSGGEASALRRTTREELAKLQRLGMLAKHLPVGLQARIAAAMKGKVI